MKIEIIKECGYEEALIGLSLSYKAPKVHMKDVALKLFNKGDGHNKFLESIMMWIDITAPRYWWQQFDTYRVGMTKQSESTMHTILKEEIDQTCFEDPVPEVIVKQLQFMVENKKFDELKNCLPEGFLQRRIVCCNYMTVRRIIHQRSKHKLSQWKLFQEEILKQARHKEFLV